MLHACTARFDVTGNLVKFWVFLYLNKALVYFLVTRQIAPFL